MSDQMRLLRAMNGIRREDVAAAEAIFMAHPAARLRLRRVAAVILAATLLLALGVMGYAAGIFDSIFARFLPPAADPEEAAWYEQAGEFSQKEDETVSLRDLPGNTFTLTESFYDGKDLILAYSLDSLRYPVQFGYGPGGENFENLLSQGRWYINAGWENMVSPEDYRRICEELRGSENTGFVIRYAWVGDHVRLADGTDLGPWSGCTFEGQAIMEWRETEKQISAGDASVPVRQDGLPEAARGRSSLELVFTIRESLLYYYKNGDEFLLYSSPLGEESVPITVQSVTEHPQ